MTVEALEAPVRLEDFGDILTDWDLARLMRAGPSWAANVRYKANRRGAAPDLPAVIPGMLPRQRYRKADVAEWLATGRSSARNSLRVPA